jgi:hypothetical protein
MLYQCHTSCIEESKAILDEILMYRVEIGGTAMTKEQIEQILQTMLDKNK